MSKPAATHVLPGDPPLPVTLRRSAAARRLTLRLSAADGRATLTLPRRLALGEALGFLRAREGWLRERLAALPAPILPAYGAAIPFEGEGRILVRALGAPFDAPGLIRLTAPPSRLGPALRRALVQAARDRAAAACDAHAAGLGVAYRRLALRDPRGRWGSASAAGDLMLSWRLVLAPPAVLGYVAAHEVAHLARMDHSPAFWAVVERLDPAWREARAWLGAHGAGLHRLRLGGATGVPDPGGGG